jgi:hypothetical protein
MMEYRRLVGTVPRSHRWLTERPLAALVEDARSALLSHYDVREREYAPKREFFQRAPEEVRILNDEGEVMASWSIADEYFVNHRHLVSSLNA